MAGGTKATQQTARPFIWPGCLLCKNGTGKAPKAPYSFSTVACMPGSTPLGASKASHTS